MSKSNNESVNPFEIATRNKWRFPSSKGEISVESLWDASLRPRGGDEDFNLNTIAKAVNVRLQKASEENFVDGKGTGAERAKQEMMLEIVKHIIQTKLDEEKEAASRVSRASEKKALLEAIAEKKAGALSDMSEKDLLARIAKLD